MNVENPEKKDNSNNTRIVVMYRLKDAERWITKSIESILDICSEIVILDDGSTDKTKVLLKSNKNLFDKLLVNEKNSGKGFSIKNIYFNNKVNT